MTDEEIVALWRQHKEVMGFAHALLAAEREMLAQPGQQDCWQEEARRYAQNAEFWRGKYEAAIAQQPDHIGDVNKMVLVEDLAAEREACARVCESIARDIYGMTNLREYGECAAAIRARGQK